MSEVVGAALLLSAFVLFVVLRRIFRRPDVPAWMDRFGLAEAGALAITALIAGATGVLVSGALEQPLAVALPATFAAVAGPVAAAMALSRLLAARDRERKGEARGIGGHRASPT
ncbi:MAG: hypothetical protein VYB54_01880 [Pseudomonadota bacterium]|nr:hypothetical protein [Pseudomonadota bacterium]